MAAKAMMSVEEYLNTEFEGADCEYVDGETIERNMGQSRHAKIQFWLGHLLALLSKRIGIQALTEVRLKLAQRRYRIPDLSVWRKGVDIGDAIPKTVPFLAIEILSPSDRPIEMLGKIQEYLPGGIEWIWVIDPYEGRARVCSRDNPAGESVTVLTTENPAIKIALSKVLSPRV